MKLINILLMIMLILTTMPYVLAEDGVALTDLSTNKDYFNVGQDCSIIYNVRNTNDYNIPIEITYIISKGGSTVKNRTYTIIAEPLPKTNTQTEIFSSGSSGSYKIDVWIRKGTAEEEHLTKTVYYYDTSVDVGSTSQSYSRYSNDFIDFYATVHNNAGNSSAYSVQIILKDNTGKILFSETNSATINAASFKTFTRQYRIKASDNVGQWTLTCNASPDGRTSAQGTDSINIYIEEPSVSIEWDYPTQISTKDILIMHSIISNKASSPVYVDIGYSIFNNGVRVCNNEEKSVKVNPAGAGYGDSIPIYGRFCELREGTYSVYLEAKVQGTNMVSTKQFELLIGQYVPSTNYRATACGTSSPDGCPITKLNEQVKLALTLENLDEKQDARYNKMLFYVKNPMGTTIYSREETNVVLTKRGTVSDTKTYVFLVLPDVIGSYELYVNINDAGAKMVTSFKVETSTGKLIAIDSLTINPSKDIGQDGSALVSFNIVNNGTSTTTVNYEIFFYSATVRDSGYVNLIGNDKSTIQKKFNGSQLALGQNKFTIRITSDGAQPVEVTDYINVNLPSGKNFKVVSMQIPKKVVPGEFGWAVSVQNMENRQVSGKLQVTYSPSIKGETQKVLFFNPNESKLIQITSTAESVDSNAFVSVIISGLEGTGGVGDYRDLDVVTKEEYTQAEIQQQGVIYRNYVILALIAVGAVVIAFLIIKLKGKKRREQIPEL
jgi:hypothetical protein